MTKKEKVSEIIGAREVVKGIENGVVKKVLVASNCPDFILKKMEKHSSKVTIERFSGDQAQLGTKVGKPFPVAVVGYSE
jgi:ribosomal protein L30E